MTEISFIRDDGWREWRIANYAPLTELKPNHLNHLPQFRGRRYPLSASIQEITETKIREIGRKPRESWIQLPFFMKVEQLFQFTYSINFWSEFNRHIDCVLHNFQPSPPPLSSSQSLYGTQWQWSTWVRNLVTLFTCVPTGKSRGKQ